MDDLLNSCTGLRFSVLGASKKLGTGPNRPYPTCFRLVLGRISLVLSSKTLQPAFNRFSSQFLCQSHWFDPGPIRSVPD